MYVIRKTKFPRSKPSPFNPKAILLLLFLLAASISCTRQIALYDEHVYQDLVNLKVESTDLLSKANEPYSNHADAAEALQVDLRKLTEYVNGMPKNDVTYRMLQKIGDPDENLLGGALKLWKDQGTLSDAFIKPVQGRVAEAFDQALELERAKIRKGP